MAWREGRKRTGEPKPSISGCDRQDRTGGPPIPARAGPRRRAEPSPRPAEEAQARRQTPLPASAALIYWGSVLALWG